MESLCKILYDREMVLKKGGKLLWDELGGYFLLW